MRLDNIVNEQIITMVARIIMVSTSLWIGLSLLNGRLPNTDVLCRLTRLMSTSSPHRHNCVKGLADYSDTQQPLGLNFSITAVVEAIITASPTVQLTLIVDLSPQDLPFFPTVESHTLFTHHVAPFSSLTHIIIIISLSCLHI